jgi:predicted nucleotidyltransferase
LKKGVGMTIEIHEIAKRIVPVLRSRGVVEASVFGSIARGDASPLSDLDLLVKYRDDVSLLDVVGLKNELESILGVKVDLVSRDYLKPRLKDRVLSESRRIL